MDCNNRGSDNCRLCRPQRPVPPGMNTDWGRPSGSSDDIMMFPGNFPGEVTINIDGNQNAAMRPDCMAGLPLGMGYVPWQRWNQTYPLSQSFQRGTIFPELDLPFMMGRCRG